MLCCHALTLALAKLSCYVQEVARVTSVVAAVAQSTACIIIISVNWKFGVETLLLKFITLYIQLYELRFNTYYRMWNRYSSIEFAELRWITSAEV